MKYFPAFLDLKGRLCVVAGGGEVAERKVRGLLKAGASVKVISPKLSCSLLRMGEEGKVDLRKRSLRSGDLKGAYLAIAATDDRTANERVYREAATRRIPVNVVDEPARCSFIVPSIVERGDLLLAVSTSGQSPALARWLRQKFQREIGPEYAFLLRLMGAVRRKVLPRGGSQKGHQRIFRKLIREDLLSLIRRKDFHGLDTRLRAILGPGYSLADLGLRR